MRPTLTLTGLYNYDNTIMDGWTFPEGVDADALKKSLLYECMDLEITLPDPDIFKVVTYAWCRRKANAWARALAAMSASYNPIHNYDRTETLAEATTGSAGASAEGSGSSTETVAAFNASTYSPKSRVSNTSESESSTTYGNQHQHTLRATGNIGVTTSQQMVQDEINLSGNLDICSVIIQDFKREFCLLVY